MGSHRCNLVFKFFNITAQCGLSRVKQLRRRVLLAQERPEGRGGEGVTGQSVVPIEA